MPRSALCVRAFAIAGAVFTLASAGVARAADAYQAWPEASGYYRLTPATRAYVDASYAQDERSDEQSLDLSAYVDLSIKPIAPGRLMSDDWQRGRAAWARVGFTRVYDSSEGESQKVEDRVVLMLFGKVPVTHDVWLEGRVRSDLRWIGREYSTRYRARLEATREFTVRGRAVTPYLNAEWFYDTRYDGWSRALYTAGAEFTRGPRFRYELYVAWQQDRLPKEQTIAALGVVLKWYYGREGLR